MESAASPTPDDEQPAAAGFRFSFSITCTCVLLAGLMLWASSWQWSKYKAKVALLQSYAEDSGAAIDPFPNGAADPAQTARALGERLYKKVILRGRFDLEHQLIVTNRRHASGPGHLLFAPFRLSGPGSPSGESVEGEVVVFVSRGFIPFDDREPESWKKYDRAGPTELVGVVKPAKSAGSTFLAPKSTLSENEASFKRLWFFEEIAAMAAQLPYPALSEVYLEKVPRSSDRGTAAPPAADTAAAPLVSGAANPTGAVHMAPAVQFPAEQVSFEIPPSTHFGYTIEWALLALGSLIVGWALQAIPSLRRKIGFDW